MFVYVLNVPKYRSSKFKKIYKYILQNKPLQYRLCILEGKKLCKNCLCKTKKTKKTWPYFRVAFPSKRSNRYSTEINVTNFYQIMWVYFNWQYIIFEHKLWFDFTNRYLYLKNLCIIEIGGPLVEQVFFCAKNTRLLGDLF